MIFSILMLSSVHSNLLISNVFIVDFEKVVYPKFPMNDTSQISISLANLLRLLMTYFNLFFLIKVGFKMPVVVLNLLNKKYSAGAQFLRLLICFTSFVCNFIRCILKTKLQFQFVHLNQGNMAQLQNDVLRFVEEISQIQC